MKALKKNTMGKYALTLIFTLTMTIYLPGRATAQGMPVYDNTNFVSLAKQLIESAKQTSELPKTVEFLKQQKERIEQVSNVIQQLDAVGQRSGTTRSCSKWYRVIYRIY